MSVCTGDKMDFFKTVADQRVQCGTVMLSLESTDVFLCCSYCGYEDYNLEGFLKHTLKSHMGLEDHEEHTCTVYTEDILDETSSNHSDARCEQEKVENQIIQQEEEEEKEQLLDLKVEFLMDAVESEDDDKFEFLDKKESKSHGTLEKLNSNLVSDQHDQLDDNRTSNRLPTDLGAKVNQRDEITQELQLETTDSMIATGANRSTVTKSNPGLPTGDTFKCDMCDKSFSKSEYLRRHIRRHGLGSHVCEYCGARFADSSNYRVHRFRHLGIKPYPCTICEKRFTNSTELRLHNRTHTSERPYECQECGKGFRTRAFLNYHGRRHRNERPHVCGTCGKTFYERHLLNDHEVSHSTERPFACDICDMAFTRLKTLKEHTKLHSDIKEHECTKCPKTFAQSSGLKSHLKSHEAKGKKLNNA